MPDKFAKVGDRRFFFFEADEKRTVAFATKRSLKRLCDADMVCMDGTFKTAPSMYEQFVTIQSFKVHVTIFISQLSGEQVPASRLCPDGREISAGIR